MKHVEAGKSVGFEMDINGSLFINLNIINEGNGKSKIVRFLIDTGFNGYLQINQADFEYLELTLVSQTTSAGYDGVIKTLGVTSTKLMLLDEEIKDLPIQVVPGGLSLIGTRLLMHLKKMLIIDYHGGSPTITANEDLKMKIKSIIDELAS